MGLPSRFAGLQALAFVSGVSGLGYELVWTRLFATSLGHEILAVAGVVAAFFAGLGLGAWLFDAPLRGTARPLRFYALLEAAIGGWALVSIFLLPAIGHVLPVVSGPAPPGAALWALAFVVPLLALLPATLAMGGTLAALEAALSRGTGERRGAAGLYAANTAGAVAGTLASLFVLAPALGFSATLAVMAGLNALCAAVAWRAERPALPPPAVAPGRLPRRLRGALFASGLLGITCELLVVRTASQVLQDTVFTFAWLLAAYLLGTTLGGALWQRAEWRRAGAPLRALLVPLTAAACLLAAALARGLPGLAEAVRPLGLLGGEAAVALALFLLPTLAMGALFAALMQAVRDARGSIGLAVALNAAGAALGPLLALLVLVPLLGVAGGLVLAAAAYLALLPPAAGRLAWGAGLPVALAAAWLLADPPPPVLPAGATLIARVEGPTATAAAVRGGDGARYLEVNGHFRMGGTGALVSDWRQAQLPLLLHPAPHTLLALGVGTGTTLSGAARFPGVAATGVELVPEVMALLPQFAIAGAVATPWPGAPVIEADARRYVRAATGSWDVIAADLFHPALDGSGALYTAEHFAAVRARLAPGGVFCQWLPLYQLDLPSLQAIIRSFLQVFPDGSGWLAHYSLVTPMLALAGGGPLLPLDPRGLAGRLMRDDIAAAVAPAGLHQAFDVLGLFLGDAAALRRFAGPGPLNTDDAPFVTFQALGNVEALTAPPAGRLVTVLSALHAAPEDLLGPLPAGDAAEAARRARLAAYWRARDRFLTAGAQLPPGLEGRRLLDAVAPLLLEVLRLSPDFEPAFSPLLAMGESLLATDPLAGRRLLSEIAAAVPNRPEPRELLLRAR